MLLWFFITLTLSLLPGAAGTDASRLLDDDALALPTHLCDVLLLLSLLLPWQLRKQPSAFMHNTPLCMHPAHHSTSYSFLQLKHCIYQVALWLPVGVTNLVTTLRGFVYKGQGETGIV